MKRPTLREAMKAASMAASEPLPPDEILERMAAYEKALRDLECYSEEQIQEMVKSMKLKMGN